MPESGDVAEVEAVIESSAAAASAPAPSRADVGGAEEAAAGGTSGAEQASGRRQRRRADKERAKAARESAERRAPREPRAPRERGRVMSFFASVIAELRKVQWPDRETLVQASAVTVLFVAVAATYLGVLDALFSRLVNLLIT